MPSTRAVDRSLQALQRGLQLLSRSPRHDGAHWTSQVIVKAQDGIGAWFALFIHRSNLWNVEIRTHPVSRRVNFDHRSTEEVINLSAEVILAMMQQYRNVQCILKVMYDPRLHNVPFKQYNLDDTTFTANSIDWSHPPTNTNIISNSNGEEEDYFNHARNHFLDSQRSRENAARRNIPLDQWLQTIPPSTDSSLEADNLTNIITQDFPEVGRNAVYIEDDVTQSRIRGTYNPNSLYTYLVGRPNPLSPRTMLPVRTIRRVPPHIAAAINRVRARELRNDRRVSERIRARRH